MRMTDGGLGLGLLVLIAACGRPSDREPAGTHEVAEFAAEGPGCEDGSVQPATGAPAEGLWSYADIARTHRVAAMIGPARSPAGAAQVTRRVEILETGPDADTIRHTSDTASVRLELLPPFVRPAAVYPVHPLVLLASYEPCGGGTREPLIRYIRRDGRGRVATDVVLRREAAP